jgi:hypothetical protein
VPAVSFSPRRRRPLAAPITSSVVAATLTAAAPWTASAVGEDEWQLGAGGGFCQLRADGRGGPGFALRVEGQRGMSDLFALRAAVGSSWTGVAAAGARPAGWTRSFHAVGGATVAYDVLRVVPFADLGVALAHVGGTGIRDAHGALGFEAGVGGEYLVDRRWAVALIGRAQYFPIVFSAADVDVGPAHALSVVLRVGRTFY